MPKSREEQLAELKALYDNGILSPEAYQSALRGFQDKDASTENHGSGTVVQGNGSVGAGEKGFAAGSISPKAEQNIISGNNNLVANFINLHWPKDEEGSEQDKENLRRQLASYLKWMLAEHGTIELRGIKRDGKQVVSLNLETVYVPLAAVHGTSQHRSFELDRILQQGQNLVITGGPGCGKTTVLQHIAYTLCRALVDERPELAEEKLGLKSSQAIREKLGINNNKEEKISLPLPIYVPLSLYDRYYKELPTGVKAEEKTLAAFISRYLVERQASFDLPKKIFQTLLRHDHAVILLLDGLDEVPGEKERSRVRAAIEDLVKARKNIRVMVTCRSAAYKNRTAIGRGFSQIQVLPLGQPHLSNMVRQGYAAIHAENPQKRKIDSENLLQSIEKLEEQRGQRSGDEFEALVDSPLMVRLLLVVHYSERRLPEQRAELYEVAVMNMLYPDYGMDNQVLEHIGGLVGGSEKKHRDLAQYIAFQMHSKGEKQGREVSEDELREILNSNPDYAELCEDFIRLTRMRGSLMEERFGMYRFIHLAFQEFLTARYLAEVLRREEKIVEFFQNNRIANSWWHEVVLLTIGYLTMNSSVTADNLICHLAGLDNESATIMNALPWDIQVTSAGLSWSAVSEWPEAPSSLKKAIPDRFLDIFNNDTLFPNPENRIEAGNLLGKLGDPRFRPDCWFLPDDDLLGFVEIPAGDFLMGDDGDKNAGPLHTVWLDRYFISRYPVTTAQFRFFVDISGYNPSNQNSFYGTANHPVTRVNWNDAVAYCNWLNETLHNWRDLPEVLQILFENKRMRILLPSEAEWEKAARGEHGRIYPWGEDKPNAERANYRDTGINSTSPVGCFPTGNTPNGLTDCSGNLWEWTRSLWGSDWDKAEFVYPYDPNDEHREDKSAGRNILRVLRGGCFIDRSVALACSHRAGGYPRDWYGGRGFRIIIAPSSPSDLCKDDRQRLQAAHRPVEQIGAAVRRRGCIT
jgi:formylglycine-generating enzyme required for sulfatase activity